MPTQQSNTQKISLTPAQQRIFAAADRKSSQQTAEEYYSETHGDYYDAYDDDEPHLNQENAEPETRAQQFKRILALSGKAIVGNLTMALPIIALMTPLCYPMAHNLKEAAIGGTITAAGILTAVHVLGAIMLALERENPALVLLMGVDWYGNMIEDNIPAIKEKFRAIKNKIARRQGHHHIKTK
ncbi:hypothetical protein HDR63_01735 [bacterium]|nr:hypothetical protein [bacterium]